MTEAIDLSLHRFWHPRYWPTWLLLLAMRLVALLPFRWQIAVGKYLGRALRYIRPSRRRIAARNLEICFPGLTDTERRALLDRHLISVGISLVEMAIAWFSPLQKLRRLIHVNGREHIDAALAKGRGVILLSAHFTPLEMGVAILEDLCTDVSCMYRPQRNTMMDVLILRGRSRFSSHQMTRDDVRALLKRLHANGIVAYMPDQTYLGNQSAVLPFFGEPAVTNIATSKLARISGAVVLPYLFRRLDDDTGYVVDVGPPLDDFPTADAVRDTRRLVAVLEDYICRAPEQYLWLYKKFKRRPEGLPDVYR